MGCERIQNDYRLHAADIAAILEERDPLEKTAGTDMLLRLEALQRYRKKDRVSADVKLLERLDKLAQSYRRLLQVNGNDYRPAEYSCGKLIAAAYPERIAMRVAKNGTQYRLANGRTASLPQGDALLHEEWLAVALLDAGQKEGKVFSAAPLDIDDVMHLSEDRYTLTWDETTGSIQATQDKVIGRITLSRKPSDKVPDAERLQLIATAIRKEN